MSRYCRSAIVVVCCSLLTLLANFVVNGSVAFAASSSSDPMVVIARDVTPLAQCQRMEAIRKPGTVSFSSIKYSACPAGTLIRTYVVPLSEAKAQHEEYILLPATEDQIQHLVSAKAPRQSSAVRPFSFCINVEKFTSTSWTFSANGDSGTTGVDWNTNSDCTLVFNWTKAKMTNCGSPCAPTSWGSSQYGPSVGNPSVTFSWTDGSGNCPTLPLGQTVQKNINQGNFSPNGFFWQVFWNNNGFCASGQTMNASLGQLS